MSSRKRDCEGGAFGTAMPRTTEVEPPGTHSQLGAWKRDSTVPAEIAGNCVLAVLCRLGKFIPRMSQMRHVVRKPSTDKVADQGQKWKDEDVGTSSGLAPGP